MRNFFEIISVAEDIRPLAILTHISAEDLELSKELGIKFKIFKIPSLTGDIEINEKVFVFYKDDKILEKFENFIKNCKDKREYTKRIGEYLGYPSCCVNKFIEEAFLKKNYLYEINRILEFLNKFVSSDDETKRKLIYSFPFDGFYPCKLPCESAVKISERIIKASSKYLKNPEKLFISSVIESLSEKFLAYSLGLIMNVYDELEAP